MALEDFLTSLAHVLFQSVDGLQAAYTFENLPANLGALPCVIVMPTNGSQDFGGANVAIHNVNAVIYCSPTNLPEAYSYCVKSISRVRAGIANNVKLGGLVDRCVPAEGVWYEIGTVNSIYGDKAYIGVIFHLTVKETGNIIPNP